MRVKGAVTGWASEVESWESGRACDAWARSCACVCVLCLCVCVGGLWGGFGGEGPVVFYVFVCVIVVCFLWGFVGLRGLGVRVGEGNGVIGCHRRRRRRCRPHSHDALPHSLPSLPSLISYLHLTWIAAPMAAPSSGFTSTDAMRGLPRPSTSG